MKINNIRIKNINSLKGEHNIAFNQAPLSDTGLFAITGPTGAGKSTMLDAITLALYNQIPRSGKMSKRTIQDFGTLITRGTNECHAEVEYQIKEKCYRSKWEISRARTGNLRDYHMEISELDGQGDWQVLDLKKSDIPNKNTELTGLNYEQFVKSIMLSQGEFARFLKANATERSELLEKITGTEIYRLIGKAAFDRYKTEQQKEIDIQTKMEGIELLSDEEQQAIEEQQKEIDKQLETITLQLKELTKQLEARKKLKKVEQKHLDVNKALEEVELQVKTFVADKERLDKHQQLLHIKDQFSQIDTLKTKCNELNQDLNSCKNKQQLLSDQLKKQTIEKEAEQLLQTKTESEREQLLPIIKQVTELDHELKTIQQQKQKQQKDVDDRQQQQNQISTELKKGEDSLKRLVKKIEKSRAQLISDKVLSEIPTTIATLQIHLASSKENHKLWKENIERLTDRKLKNALTNKPQWIERTNAVNKQIESIEEHCVELNKLLSNQPFKDSKTLESLKENNQFELKEITSIQQTTAQYEQLLKEKKQLEQKQKELLKNENECKKSLQTLTPQVEAKKLLIAELKIRHERQLLEQSLGEHRNLLKPNEACPLCGSHNHPYVDTYSDNVSQTAQQLKENEKELKQLELQNNDLTNKETALSRDIANHNKQIEKLQRDSKQHQLQFQEAAKRLHIELAIDNRDELNQYASKTKQTEAALKNAGEAFYENEKLKNKLLLLTNISRYSNEICTVEQEIEQLLLPYSNYITPDTKVVDKREELITLNQNYDKLKQTIDNDELTKGRTEEQINSLQKQLSTITIDLEKESKSLQEINKSYEEKKRKRIELFGTKHPTTEQQKVENKLTAGNKKMSEIASKLSACQEAIKQQKEIETKYTTGLQTSTKEHQSLNSQLLQTVNKLNYPTIEEAKSNILSQSEEQQIKQKSEKITEQKTRFNQELKIINQELDELKPKVDNRELSHLEEEKRNIETQQREHNQQLGGLKERLDSDTKNRAKAGDLVQELKLQQKELKRWANLNELIGDATGNKYSKFAQELTLQQMLSLANKHLTKLNKRYLLKYNPKQNEDLFIIDLLQGNEERSVRTLSGGESFLISLALALGLSDLAGQNTQLESLFIDEGFGSLDQVTLEMALSTLERLQSESNRTIGIISHVEALKERITTQIELQKDSSGNSKIEIKS